MNDIDIQSVKASAEIVIRVELTGAPPTLVKYTTRMIQPDKVKLVYTLRLDGAGAAHWRCWEAVVYGQRILNPGPGGEQRLGKDRGNSDWSVYGRTTDLAEPDRSGQSRVPEWVAQLITEMRPAGEIHTVGDLD